ncbi:MAG: carbon storage regulator [Gemmataceae bacterium]|jgi:carbon storage regulator|nr:carbon storage regulator [Gemmataceae bacterium]
MLVLSRKVGEKILVGNNIVLTVVEVNGNRVRLGIEAPRDMAVVRGELVGKGRDLDAEMPKPKTALSETGLDNEMPEGSHFDLVLN